MRAGLLLTRLLRRTGSHFAGKRYGSIAVLLTALCLTPVPAIAQQTNPEMPKLRLAVGGKPALFYLPLTVTERLGYFRDQGLDIEISDFPGGARALQALIGGSADVVTGSFEHTIQMQAKSQQIKAVMQLGQFPGCVLAVLAAKAQRYRRPADLKGMKIGITAPGSGTHLMVQHFMVRNGLAATDASFVGVGASASAVAAVQRGEIDAIVNVDPMISLLESQGLIKIVADTRTLDGTRQVFGGLYPAAVLYAGEPFIAKNPRTVQALANALVRGLKWIATHSAEEIASVMPEDYALGKQAALHPVDPQQSADVFARRPLQPGGGGDRRDRAQGVRPGRRARQHRHRRDLHRRVRGQGVGGCPIAERSLSGHAA
jgi:NitT/TauT family transport system substrate-binding protein